MARHLEGSMHRKSRDASLVTPSTSCFTPNTAASPSTQDEPAVDQAGWKQIRVVSESYPSRSVPERMILRRLFWRVLWQVSIVEGETGSGKTTQVRAEGPQWSEGRGRALTRAERSGEGGSCGAREGQPLLRVVVMAV